MSNNSNQPEEKNCDAMGHYGGNSPGGVCPKCGKQWKEGDQEKGILTKAVIDYADLIVKQEAEIKRLKALVETAWHQAIINCEVENGSCEIDGAKYIHLRAFKQSNNLT